MRLSSHISRIVARATSSPVTKLRRRSSTQALLFVLSLGIGVVTGACAALLKWCIGRVSVWLTSPLHIHGFNYALIALPVVGIVLTGIYQRYIVKADLQHGVRRIAADIRRQQYHLPSFRCYAAMIASTLTLGFGGSAGSEGPIASTGAAIGSNVGRLFRIDGRLLMVLVGVGAGAGIAGIFKAPVGGMLFTLEVLRLEISTVSVIALLLACVASALTAYALSGFTVDLAYSSIPVFDTGWLVWLVVFAAIVGLYSMYYSVIMHRMDRFYSSMRNPWLKNVLSGLVAGAIIFFFPAMYGEGYGVMHDLLNGDNLAIVTDSAFATADSSGWWLVGITGGIVSLKALACSSSNCGGGVAGDFAPTLFAGCMLGICFATTANLIFGAGLPVSVFAFCGMAGVMSGTIRAPFMAIFLTAEMSSAFSLFLPIVLVAAVSIGMVRLFRPPLYYSAHDLSK